MTHNAPDRDTIVVIVADSAVHFTSGPLQTTGTGASLWFPLDGLSVFSTVERIMTMHQLAHHCVDIQSLRRCGDSTDYEVTFSPYTKAKSVA